MHHLVIEMIIHFNELNDNSARYVEKETRDPTWNFVQV